MASPSALSEVYCYVNLRLVKKLQAKKDKIASTRVDPEGRWGDFFEAALLDNIDDEREAEEQNECGALILISTVMPTTSTKI
jgi:hypothetical protein